MVNYGDPALILLISLVLSLCTSATVPNVVLVSAADILEFSFDSHEETGKSFGDSFLVLESTLKQSKFPFVSRDGEIYLTQDPTDGTHSSTLYNVGRVTYNKSLPIKDDQHQILSFNTSLRFNITTTTKYNESGDGIAFVMTSDKHIPSNSTGRFLGLMPESPAARHERFFAVEFDTFQNLQAEIADPSASHIGIDINNLSSVAYLNTANESDPLYLYHNYTFTAWISYNASTHLISVWATNDSDSLRPNDLKPAVTSRHNLSEVFENFTDLYVAIIAASGNNSQAAILYSWSFTLIDPQDHHGPHQVRYYLVPSVIGFLCLLVAAAAIGLRWKKSAKRQREERAAIEMASWGFKRYKYRELMQATCNFNTQSRIGSGGFSTVYRGVLRDKSHVAVKRMKDFGARMELDTIVREVQIISQIRHRNLLQLRGWCYEKGEALLVYDYMPRGSLDSYLYGERRRLGQVLDGETRFKILVGAAAALEYLHGDLPGSHRVLHRDVKAANVLLTDTLGALLADFGLSRLIADDTLLVTLTAAGTPGYVAPEVMQTGRVDDKADVYSFGVLLVEVACGRQALDPFNSQYSRLVDWVWLRHQQKSILDVLDPQIVHVLGDFNSSTSSISSSFSLESSSSPSTSADTGYVKGRAAVSHDTAHAGADHPGMQKWRCVLHLGLLCCQAQPDARPCMREVHQALRECRVLTPPQSWTLYPAAVDHGCRYRKRDTR